MIIKKENRKYFRFLKNQKGEITNLTPIFVFLLINAVMAMLLLFATTQIQCMKIRNAIRQELNNTATIISEDTYQAMREDDLDAYIDKLLDFNGSYQAHLRQIFTDNLSAQFDLITEDYAMVARPTLTFSKDGSDRIAYTANTTVYFRVALLPDWAADGLTIPVSITSYFNTKF